MNDAPRPLMMLDNYDSDHERIQRAIFRERSRQFFLDIWRKGQDHNQLVRKLALTRKETP